MKWKFLPAVVALALVIGSLTSGTTAQPAIPC